MAKKTLRKKSFLDSLKDMVGGGKSGGTKRRKKAYAKDQPAIPSRDPLTPFYPPTLDMDALINPPADLRRPRPCPTELDRGVVLLSQRNGVKCILLDPLVNVDREVLKNICGHRFKSDEAVYLSVGTQVLREEALHQGRSFASTLRKGTLFLSPGGHPVGYLLDSLSVPLSRELGSIRQYLPVTEQTAKRYLQSLVDIPSSFSLVKEDLFFDTSEENTFLVEKGTLVISRSGFMTALLLDDLQLPIKGKVADLDVLFQLKTTYQRYPIETLIQQVAKSRSETIPIERGTFLFSPRGRVYFVWKEGLTASEQELVRWSMQSQIIAPEILEVSLQKRNVIGGPGEVITQDELNYLRDVFRTAGTTNIFKETLLLDRNVFFKFTMDMPYAQSGKFRSYIGKGGVVQLNTFRQGTFSVEMGGKDIEITDLDLVQVRKHLQPEGRILVKIGSFLRIRDERHGDWIYYVSVNLFYPYETFTRPYLEEFIPESVRFERRGEKLSTLIGPQDDPSDVSDEDIGASGEPLADLRALINNELQKDPPRTVIVLDGALFHWRGLYRVNEELIFRPQQWTEKIQDEDLEAFEAEWKIHPLVEDMPEEEDELPPSLEEEDEDLDDLPFDSQIVR